MFGYRPLMFDPEKITQEQLLGIYQSPADFGEMFLINRNKTPRKYWPHQRMDLEDAAQKIIHQNGTETGKSIDAATLILHHLFATNGELMLVTAPLAGHYSEIIEEVNFQFDNNPFLKSILDPKRGRIRTPYPHFKSKRGSIVYFRPSDNGGEAFKHLHVHKIIIDEAAGVDNRAWRKIYNRLLGKGQIRAYCYPDGRTDTEYFVNTQGEVLDALNFDISDKPGGEGVEAGRFVLDNGWVKYVIPMMMIPAGDGSNGEPYWNMERYLEKVREHRGTDTASYQHMVLGQHGVTTSCAFDIEGFFSCLKPVDGYEVFEIRGSIFDSLSNETEVNNRIVEIFGRFGPIPKPGSYWLGADTGYQADPAELVIWHEDEMKIMTRVLRIHCEHVQFPHQEKIIAQLDRAYHFNGIGIDAGANGTSIYQNLMTKDEFRDLLHLNVRLVSVNFGGTVLVQRDQYGRDVRQDSKPFYTQLLNSAMRRRTAIWPKQDQQSEFQYTSHKFFVKGNSVTYSKGNDHIVDADRCAFFVREMILVLRVVSGGYTSGTIIVGQSANWPR